MSGGRWVLVAVAALVGVDLIVSSGWVARAAPRLTRRSDGSVRGPLVWAWTVLVLAYRAVSSGRVGGVCRFEPSCSVYALDAVRTYGGVRGGVLAGYRLLRCQPLSEGGFDPVPERGLVPGRDAGNLRRPRGRGRPAFFPSRFRSRRGRPATAADPSVGTRA